MNKLHYYTEKLKGLDRKIDLSKKVLGNSLVSKNVWLKLHEARCVTKWRPDTITREVSEQVVEVDGMPRHVKHIRLRSGMLQGQIGDMANVEIEVGYER